MKVINLEEGVVKIPQNGTKIGIESLKNITTHVGGIAQKIQKYKADGQYSFWEKMNTGFAVVGSTIQIATDAGQIWKEIQDLDQEEIHQLVMHFASHFKIDTKKADMFVKNILIPVLKMLEEGITIINGVDDVFGKNK